MKDLDYKCLNYKFDNSELIDKTLSKFNDLGCLVSDYNLGKNNIKVYHIGNHTVAIRIKQGYKVFDSYDLFVGLYKSKNICLDNCDDDLYFYLRNIKKYSK
jgi:hypothetical protein